MSKIIKILLLCIAFCFSADVKPFYFNSVPNDSISQQAEFDYMLKYKLFGHDYLKMGNDVKIPDKSGWNGTAGDFTANARLNLGGPTLVTGDIILQDQPKLLTGPIRGKSLSMTNTGGYFAGTVCIADTSVIQNNIKEGIKNAEGTLVQECPEMPEPPVNLQIPTIPWPTTMTHDDIIISDNDGVVYIDVPDGDSKEPYDIYIDKIHTGVGGTNGSKIFVRMQDGGRLVRIFVHDLQIGNHATINAVYRTNEGDKIQSQKEYRGNILFYTDNDITFERTDNVPIQGTFITTGKIYLACNLDFAGQLIANELEIGNDFKGENFKFVPFDTPLVDIDPELNEKGGLVENDSTVIIPIKLSDTATVDVYFSYCFELNETVTIDDFNIVTAFPICGEETKTVMIPVGAKVPTEQIKINVKIDTLVENTDTLKIKINIESGAVLPNRKTDGILKVKLIDNLIERIKIDTDGVAKSVPENKKDTVLGKITVDGGSNTTILKLAPNDTTKYSLVNGILTLKVPYDYEVTQKDTITLIAVDCDKTDTVDFVIDIIDVNENPIVEKQTFTIDENKKGYVGTITWNDTDSLNSNFRINTCTLISTTDTSFHVADGKITTTKTHDFETEKEPVLLVVKIQDKKDSTLFVIDTMKVTFNNVNEDIVATAKIDVIPEDTDIGTIIGVVLGKDIDSTDVSYTIDSKDFIINPTTGVITTNTKFDYETKNEYPVKVTITSEDGSKKDTMFVITVSDVNEPHTIKDEIVNIPENTKVQTPIDTVKVTDPDLYNDIKFELIDTTGTFKIDSNGVITLVKPVDYETKKEYEVTVIAKDSLYTDTAIIKINITNVDESSKLTIQWVETRDTTITDTDKPIYTNRPSVLIDYKVEGITIPFDTTFNNLKEGENKIKICYTDSTKDKPGCDEVTIYYSSATPIITTMLVNTDKATINGQTIVDVPDGKQYVNKEQNNIKVTVKDPVDPRNDTTFVIKVDLHTIDVPAKVITNKVVEPIEDTNLPMKHEVIGTNEIKVSYYDPIVKATISYITDTTGKRKDENFTVEYVEKVAGKDVTISYTTDSYTEVKGNYTISYIEVNGTDTMLVSYDVNENGVVQKNKDNNVGYTVSYSYTNKYGNTGTSKIFVILDTIKPSVKIITPIGQDVYYTNSIEVVWSVDDVEQDTLKLERLEKGLNNIMRCYQDKALNISCDTVYVFMKNAKDIEIAIINPVTEINQDRVDSFFAAGGKYSKKEPFQVLIQDPKIDELPEPVGIGLKVNIVLPSVSSTGGLATVDDLIQVVNGQQGVLVNKHGKLVSGTSTGADGSYTIPVETYIENHCNDEYKREYKKNGLEHTTIWDVKYNMNIWIFNTTGQYVNYFNFEYTLDDTNLANNAGILTMVVDWLADKDGNIKSANGNAIATGSYITKLEAKSLSKTRCDLPNQPIGFKVKKTDYELTSFGYKRPMKK